MRRGLAADVGPDGVCFALRNDLRSARPAV